MKPHYPTRTRSLCIMVATMFAWGICTPETVHASCGDYVLMAPDTNTAAHSGHPYPKRCSGPNCSQAPLPVQSMPSLPIETSHEWGLSASTLQLALAVEAFRSPDEFISRPIHEGPGIYHPPRSSR